MTWRVETHDEAIVLLPPEGSDIECPTADDFAVALERCADLLNALEADKAHLEAALRHCHDAMDDDNARTALRTYCRWCRDEGYDGDGLRHKPNCPLVEARAVLEPLT